MTMTPEGQARIAQLVKAIQSEEDTQKLLPLMEDLSRLLGDRDAEQVLLVLPNKAPRNSSINVPDSTPAKLPRSSQDPGTAASVARKVEGGRAPGEHGINLRGTSFHRSQSSSSTPRSVFSSRYLTMTGVYSERFHSCPLPLVTAREPGTTTAFSGTSRGRSGAAR